MPPQAAQQPQRAQGQELASQAQTQAPSQQLPDSSVVLGFRQYEQARRALVDAKRKVGLDLLARDGAIPAPVLAAVR